MLAGMSVLSEVQAFHAYMCWLYLTCFSQRIDWQQTLRLRAVYCYKSNGLQKECVHNTPRSTAL
jgi:hypothetical protein